MCGYLCKLLNNDYKILKIDLVLIKDQRSVSFLLTDSLSNDFTKCILVWIFEFV